MKDVNFVTPSAVVSLGWFHHIGDRVAVVQIFRRCHELIYCLKNILNNFLN
jgi:hypothetical protein